MADDYADKHRAPEIQQPSKVDSSTKPSQQPLENKEEPQGGAFGLADEGDDGEIANPELDPTAPGEADLDEINEPAAADEPAED